ncbi:MAG: zinc metalloprotease HtpX [Nanoarchaeota archaeon]|nr:zinc metalloprotease HtpX [Nanoarchaeota archaeon]
MGFANHVKTVVLLGLLTGLLLWIGSFFGANGLTTALILAFVMNFASYFWSDKIVLWIYKAKEADQKEHARLYKLVHEVVHAAGIPMPKVFILPTEHSNAFATGRNPTHATLAFSMGILSLLNDTELKGVIAHEAAHVKNRDILIASVAAMIAGVISYLAAMARWAAIFGGFGGRDQDNGSNIFEFLVLAILTPILATLIQLAISRSREFHADASGAKMLHSGVGLASALEKLEADIAKKPLKATSQIETTAHVMIANPFKGGALVRIFSTHPPMQERIKRLRAMTF